MSEEQPYQEAEPEGLDPSVDWGRKDQEANELGGKMLAQIAGAGVGLALGGPAGAAVGALAGAGLVPVLEHLIARSQDRALKRAHYVLQEAAERAHVSPDDLIRWALTTEQRETLLVTALNAATNSATQQKLVALARIVVDNIHDDRDIYVSSLIVKALTDMEQPHILALCALMLEDLPRDQSWNLGSDAFAQAQLERRFPSFAAGMPQILATFEGHGIAIFGLPVAADNKAGSVTDFGRRCFEYLRNYPLPPDARTGPP